MFWDIFYSLCQNKGKKPLQVVKDMDIAGASITKWKNGSIPSASNLKKLSDYFGVTVDYLLGKDTEHTSQNELEENTVKYRFKGETVTKTFTEEQMEAISAMIKTIPNIK